MAIPKFHGSVRSTPRGCFCSRRVHTAATHFPPEFKCSQDALDDENEPLLDGIIAQRSVACVAELLRAMPICLEADKALTKCKKEKREPTAEEIRSQNLASYTLLENFRAPRQGCSGGGASDYYFPAQTKLWGRLYDTHERTLVFDGRVPCFGYDW